MTMFFLVLWVLTSIALAVFYFLKGRSDQAAAAARQAAQTAEAESRREIAQARQEFEAAARAAAAESQQEIVRSRQETQAATTHAQQTLEARLAELAQLAQAAEARRQREIAQAQQASQAAVAHAQQMLEARLTELAGETERARSHYEAEALRIHHEAAAQVESALAELAPLRGYASLQDAENEVRKSLAEAIAEATALRREAQLLLDQTKEATSQDRVAAQARSREIRTQADTLLVQATRDAARITEAAQKRAEETAGDAYVALRDKQTLEAAVNSLWNVVGGYGDRYVVPTHSLLDDLAADFGHTQAGEELRAAREQSHRLVEMKLAADCNYEETDRRERANRFVVDAFNGRVDAILSRTKHDNFGTLRQEIHDAFNTVNLNGLVFRDARILPEYLDARLAELQWAVVVRELKQKEREEQRELQEKMREEEKARRECQRAMQEAAREEVLIKQAMAKARAEAESAAGAERSAFEERLAELSQKLVDAEARGQRALSMAQQTRSGNVYIISNVGSFGEDVFKIGMTRRLVPDDRIKELGGASVPFEFDVHAMIQSSDAPALERLLHQAFADARINKVNHRKEFFRFPLERLREFAVSNALDVTFTMTAEAREYRETLALEKMTPEEREKYQLREPDEQEELAAALAEDIG